MLAALSGLPLGDVLRRTAATHPDRPALLGEHRSLTWRELDDEVDRVAVAWEDAGIGPGTVIAFMLDKRPEVVVGFLACARVGAIFVPVNHKLQPEQVEDQFEVAGVTALVWEPAHQALADRLARGVRWSIRVDQLDPGRDASGRRPSFVATADTPCYYNYTSGSTGRPKGAITTSRNILVNAVATAEGLGFAEDDVYLGMFSVFAHPHELFHRSILYGGAFVVVDSLSPRHIAETIQRFRVTWMMAVPSFYEMLLDFRGSRQEGAQIDLGSLRVLEAGGAYVSPAALERMERAFTARFLPVWGSTETTGVGIGMLAGASRRPGSTGKPIPGYTMRVVGEDGADVAAGTVGELWVRGEAVAHGYVNQPEETAAQFQDGWYATRDLVYTDADGFVYFSGRRSEMLKIGGIRVFPLEIEQVVALHPEVRNVVVVRAEERLRGEVARAIVQVEPGSTLTVRALQRWCRDRLASYKVPRIVEFWRAIPTLPNGKIDKKAVVVVPVDAARDER
ncbi:MAG: class I adenylate-forming enzyme family protein [Pseudomonadota bacterium]|nr:class I adenylate-forming enzyme family protein [Pseudomonadota bacterium]